MIDRALRTCRSPYPARRGFVGRSVIMGMPCGHATTCCPSGATAGKAVSSARWGAEMIASCILLIAMRTADSGSAER